MIRAQFENFINLLDYNRIKSYCQNQIDYHLILDLVPTFTKLYYMAKLGDVSLGYINQVLLVGIGLQYKSIEEVCKEVNDLDTRNALAIFQKTMIKFNKISQRIFEVFYKLFKGNSSRSIYATIEECRSREK